MSNVTKANISFKSWVKMIANIFGAQGIFQFSKFYISVTIVEFCDLLFFRFFSISHVLVS